MRHPREMNPSVRPGTRAGSTRRDRTSDLARKNLERVAASAAQLQTVLIKEAGILVELKRWVAKEATDNGQVVEDNDLTDQAIFDRLDRDLGFRSVATQLVQRYGYLLPNLNPDSDAAKEQDLILKERARRFVQLEAQEDAAPPAAQQTQNNDNNKNNTGARTERTSCDSRNQDCDMRDLRRRQSARQPSDEMTTPSFPGSDMLQQMPSSDQLRSLRMASGRDESGLGSSGADGGLSLASDSSRRASSSLGGSASAMGGMAGGGMSGGMGGMMGGNIGGMDDIDRLLRQRSMDDVSGLSGGGSLGSSMASNQEPNRTYRVRDEDHGRSEDTQRDLTPMSMVRKRSPYADIPSLYDMYVQAAPRGRDPERFGLEIFRNGTRDSESLPMDLPVGPDYVVGPGDGLSINLWGGVSQRMVRQVDREGRINLPEAGPLLVSGRTLGEVQESVQQVLRTQFRDISADVSLSRLRTIRVYVVGEVDGPGLTTSVHFQRP